VGEVKHRRLLRGFYGARFTGRGVKLHEAFEDAWVRAKHHRDQAMEEAQEEADAEGVTFDFESKQEFVVDEIRIICENPVKEYVVFITPD
jgi:hypothetical protein